MSDTKRRMRLEDGEEVVRLRRGKRGKHEGWKSDLPHSGAWGKAQGYVLVPCRYPNRRAKQALAFDPELVDRSSDAEVLLLGTPEQIERLTTEGPSWCRAQRRRPPSYHGVAAGAKNSRTQVALNVASAS